jgi:hypothetical protein
VIEKPLALGRDEFIPGCTHHLELAHQDGRDLVEALKIKPEQADDSLAETLRIDARDADFGVGAANRAEESAEIIERFYRRPVELRRRVECLWANASVSVRRASLSMLLMVSAEHRKRTFSMPSLSAKPKRQAKDNRNLKTGLWSLL